MKASTLLFLVCLALVANEGLGFGYADCYCSCMPPCKAVKHWYNVGGGQQCYCSCECPENASPPKPPTDPTPPINKPPNTPNAPAPSIPPPPVSKPPNTPSEPKCVCPQAPKAPPQSPPANQSPPPSEHNPPLAPKNLQPPTPRNLRPPTTNPPSLTPKNPPPPTTNPPAHGRPWQNVPLCISLMNQVRPCMAKGWQLYAYPRFNLDGFCCNIVQQVRDNCNPWLFYGVDLSQHCG